MEGSSDSNLVVLREGITPAAQLRNFLPGSRQGAAKTECNDAVLGEEAGEDPAPEVEDLEEAGRAPKSTGDTGAGRPSVANSARNVRELRSCLAMREQFRAELESRVAEFVQSEDLLGSIVRNEKSERQLEQRLAHLKGVEHSPKSRAKGPYMLSVALNSLPQTNSELQTLPGQCDERLG